MEIQAREINKIKMQKVVAGETGNEHLVKIRHSAERGEMWKVSQKQLCNFFIADTWKYIAVCVVFNEVCFYSADVIIWIRKSSLVLLSSQLSATN